MHVFFSCMHYNNQCMMLINNERTAQIYIDNFTIYAIHIQILKCTDVHIFSQVMDQYHNSPLIPCGEVNIKMLNLLLYGAAI